MASILFFIIQLLSEVLLTYALIASGMIPTRFIILAILVEIVLLVVSWVLAYREYLFVKQCIDWERESLSELIYGETGLEKSFARIHDSAKDNCGNAVVDHSYA